MIACNCEVCNSADDKDKRLRTSILVESSKTTIVIDTTPDFRYQMLRVPVKKLDAVLYTHPHKDHVAGMDDVKAFCYFSGLPMQVYANQLTADALKNEFYYVFAENKYPGIPEVNLNLIKLEPFTIGDIPIIPIQVWHLKMPVFGYRFGDFTYITDANRIEDIEKEKIKGSKYMVINALRHKQHISHYSLDEAVALVKELEIPQAFLTHISHQLGKYKDVRQELPEGIDLAWDGLEINV